MRFLVDWNSTKWQDLSSTTPVTSNGQTVAVIDDRVAGRKMRGFTVGESPVLSSTGGPGGNSCLQFRAAGTPDGPLYYATGSDVLFGPPVTVVYMARGYTTGVDTPLAGRGYSTGNGTYYKMDTLGRNVAQITTDSVARNRLQVFNDTTWRTMVQSWDGTNELYAYARGASPFVQASTQATAGTTLSFNAADTALWIGAATASGASFTAGDDKDIALYMILGRAMASATEAADLLNSVRQYAGIFP